MDEAFVDLYHRLVNASLHNHLPQELKEVRRLHFDEHHLDCLLHPEKYPPVISLGDCVCNEDQKAKCAGRCLFDALTKDENGNITVNRDLCTGCALCVDNCKAERLTASREVLPFLKVLSESKAPVYALVAPAFIGQYSEAVTPGMLRTALKRLGFAGMIEVALFADILTLKEALEFDRTILHDEDFLLTSCCCPIWIAMIRRVYDQFMSHVPAAVSPMVACGRSIKLLYPDAVTVFIGPCVAKKAEAKEPDIADAVDFVLTFQEVRDIFEFAGIRPEEMEEDPRDHSSRGGRIYARTGGVSEAVQTTVERLRPDRAIRVQSRQADGVPACKKLLTELTEGKITANFLEGMGCVGGCVGGPKAICNREEGKQHVDHYGEEAAYRTPAENPYVIELLHRLGLETVESLLEESDIFTRDFSKKGAH
jgi:iron only hydrogenase large subunit-like protein